MYRVIDLVQESYQLCADCKRRDYCTWFRQATQVIFDDLNSDQYCKLTQEDIANKIHRNNPEPDDCNQHSYRQLMQYVTGFIDTATIPDDAQAIVNLVYKMHRPIEDLYTLSPEVIDAFDPIVRSLIGKALAGLDYHFLRKKIDISELLLTVHKDYQREQLMGEYYTPAIFSALKKKACILSLDDILSCEGQLSEVQPVTTPNPENSAKADAKSKVVKSWVDDFISYVKTSKMAETGIANLILLGYSPLLLRDVLTDDLRKKYLSEYLTPVAPFKYEHYRQLTEELSEKIRPHKYNPHAVKVYLTKILTHLDDLSGSIFPYGEDDNSLEISAIVKASGFLESLSVADVKDLIARSKKQLNSGGQQRTPVDYYDDLYNLLVNESKDAPAASSLGPLGVIQSIVSVMSLFEASLEAALLTNGLPVDYHFFESYANVHFAENVCDIMICGISGYNPSAVVHMAKELGHSIYVISKPGESSAEFSYRLFKGGLGNADMIIPSTTREIPEWAEPDKKPIEQISLPEKQAREKEPAGKDNKPNLPPSLRTEKAMAIWKKAQEANIVDDKYEFLGSISEMAFFAGEFSNYLFGKSRWTIFRKWSDYENYSKTYHEYAGKSLDKLSEEMKQIYYLFH